MSSADTDKKGMTSGIMTTIWTLGLSFGVTLFETIFSSTGGSDFIAISKGEHSKISIEALLPAFRNSYILGASACLVSLVFFILLFRLKRKTER
jgi:hypothetical protein